MELQQQWPNRACVHNIDLTSDFDGYITDIQVFFSSYYESQVEGDILDL